MCGLDARWQQGRRSKRDMGTHDSDMQHLLEQLKDTNEKQRFSAAQELGQQGDARAVDGLTRALNDDNHKVKYAALSSLVKIGSTEAATPTIAALLDDLDSRLWKLITLDIGMRLRNGLFAMIERDNTEVADLLTAALDRSDLSQLQRALIIRLIGRTGDPRLVETFIDMLMIGDETLQGAAGEALGYIGDARAVAPLMVVLEDADSAVREIAINALARIGDTRAGTSILPLLESNDPWTRRAAAAALGQLGDRRAVRKLMHMLRDDEDQEVRQAADEALSRLIPADADTDGE